MTTPNDFDIVQQVNNEHPELLQTNTLATVQQFMSLLGPRLAERHVQWGYLSKTPAEKHITINGVDVAVDAFIYLATQEVFDVISNGADPAYGPGVPCWSGPQEKRDENNWVQIAEAPPTPDSDLEERVTTLESTVASQDVRIGALEKYTANLESSIADLAALIQQPMRCHGPVDLPIVLESFTSLRAKGDINVAVEPGQAEPPVDTGDDGIAHPGALWRWLRNRRDPDPDEDGGS